MYDKVIRGVANDSEEYDSDSDSYELVDDISDSQVDDMSYEESDPSSDDSEEDIDKENEGIVLILTPIEDNEDKSPNDAKSGSGAETMSRWRRLAQMDSFNELRLKTLEATAQAVNDVKGLAENRGSQEMTVRVVRRGHSLAPFDTNGTQRVHRRGLVLGVHRRAGSGPQQQATRV
ncbi:unnamed protein product [Oppiella nova]|uniref:Uncharacterized protein n=1 Tax=Oppiella nova TaxID=334625 RepID=A0A7R9M6E0_9ACAR|nr:unnamed protein product [Oppiella nova]CAG2171081.1 unnamed protein product [Oppiella nova]